MKVSAGSLAFVAAAFVLSNGLASASNCTAEPAEIRNIIKKVIFLSMENQPFARLFGGLPNVQGIDPKNPPCYSANSTDPNNHNLVCATPNATNNITHDPDHSFLGTAYSMYETFSPNDTLIQAGKLLPQMRGCVTRQGMVYNLPVNESSLVARFFLPERLPVLTTLANEFVLFDKYFSMACSTRPNRCYMTSGTSQGFCTNDDRILNGGLNSTSVFEAVTKKGRTYKDYSDSSIPDSADYNWTIATGHSANIHPVAQFLVDLREGTLPDLAYIKGGNAMDMHPPANITNGEGFIALLYDSLRASKYWEESLMIITWDEAGGQCDPYPPPHGIPRPDNRTYTVKAPDGTNATYMFDFLGPRVGNLLISPHVKKGVVESDGVDFGRIYTHTSWLHWLSNLWELEGLDNPRISWSATFDHLIFPEVRQDTPETLPRILDPDTDRTYGHF